ncbi:MAG TPA: hypothetical protein VMZ04_06020 [Anaerolineae bacterium]|nr:hypothetical protein [Anaerolineae bacterium]
MNYHQQTFQRKKVYVLIILTSLMIPNEVICEKLGNFGVHFTVASPQGEFRDNVDRNGYGISGNGMIRMGLLPMKLGLELGYVRYGSESRREPLSTTIPDVTVRVQNDNNIFLGHILLRVQPPLGPLVKVTPYIDGLVGFNYLFTETKIEDVDKFTEVVSSTNFDDLTLSYGIGGGLMFKLADLGAPGPGLNIMGILLDIKVRYLYGGEAEYLKKGSIRRENGKVFYDATKSKTDLMLYQLGIVFSF